MARCAGRIAWLERIPHPCWLGLALGLLLALPAWAQDFEVLDATVRLRQEVYLLDARIAYRFPPAPLDALANGVQLVIELDLEVWRNRNWMFDEPVARLQQRFQLEYHALSRQYLVTNLNSGDLKSFRTLTAAIDALGRINDFPLLDASLMTPGFQYYGRLRAGLDIESLPVPLRIYAYTSRDWWLVSAWYRWTF